MNWINKIFIYIFSIFLCLGIFFIFASSVNDFNYSKIINSLSSDNRNVVDKYRVAVLKEPIKSKILEYIKKWIEEENNIEKRFNTFVALGELSTIPYFVEKIKSDIELITMLEKSINEVNPTIKFVSATMLSLINDRKYSALFVKYINDPDIGEIAGIYLSRNKNIIGIHKLMEDLKKNKYYATRAVGDYCIEAAVSILLKKLNSDDKTIVFLSAESLIKMKRKEGIPFLIELLKDEKFSYEASKMLASLSKIDIKTKDEKELYNLFLTWWEENRSSFGFS